MTQPEHFLEQLLKTYQHIRVFKILAISNRAMTRYEISKQTGINAATVSKILHDFSKQGWTTQTIYRPTKYKINTANPLAKKFIEFLQEARYL